MPDRLAVNILLRTPSVDELTRCFATHAPVPLLPTQVDDAWQAVRTNPVVQPWLEAIKRKASAELTEPMPKLTDYLYADYRRTGKRLSFEHLYFERRRRVARAACATLTETGGPNREAFTRSLLDKIQQLFNEPSWCVPEQVKNDTGQDPMIIDLFGAETANLFGELLNIFGGMLPAELVQAVQHRLRTQYWDNYLSRDFWWFTSKNNWNSVCHQGVIGSALALSDDASLLAQLISAAMPRLRVFIEAFGADGSTSEGLGYWSYGFGWFSELNRQLETRTRGELSLFEGDPRIGRIAMFGPQMALSNGLAVNFADCSAHATPRPGMLAYLGQRMVSPVLQERAGVAWAHALRTPIELDGERDDFMRLSRQLLRAPHGFKADAQLPSEDVFFQSLDLQLSRFKDDRHHLWEFAVKAGNNDELHNHNDVGSYILNVDGHRLLTEIGMPEYDAHFFGPKRYDYLAARSLGHPVPRINGQEQGTGGQYCGNVIRRTSDANHAAIQIDLTDAYPATAGVERVLRSVQIDKRAGLLRIEDQFAVTGDVPVEVALTTDADAAFDGNAITISAGTSAILVVVQGDGVSLHRESYAYVDHEGQPASITRIAIRAIANHPTASIACEVRVR